VIWLKASFNGAMDEDPCEAMGEIFHAVDLHPNVAIVFIPRWFSSKSAVPTFGFGGALKPTKFACDRVIGKEGFQVSQRRNLVWVQARCTRHANFLRLS
jgi:hypothetical protein